MHEYEGEMYDIFDEDKYIKKQEQIKVPCVQLAETAQIYKRQRKNIYPAKQKADWRSVFDHKETNGEPIEIIDVAENFEIKYALSSNKPSIDWLATINFNENDIKHMQKPIVSKALEENIQDNVALDVKHEVSSNRTGGDFSNIVTNGTLPLLSNMGSDASLTTALPKVQKILLSRYTNARVTDALDSGELLSVGNVSQWREGIIAGELTVHDWLNAQEELPAGMEWSSEDIQIFERTFQQYPNNRIITPQSFWNQMHSAMGFYSRGQQFLELGTSFVEVGLQMKALGQSMIESGLLYFENFMSVMSLAVRNAIFLNHGLLLTTLIENDLLTIEENIQLVTILGELTHMKIEVIEGLLLITSKTVQKMLDGTLPPMEGGQLALDNLTIIGDAVRENVDNPSLLVIVEDKLSVMDVTIRLIIDGLLHVESGRTNKERGLLLKENELIEIATDMMTSRREFAIRLLDSSYRPPVENEILPRLFNVGRGTSLAGLPPEAREIQLDRRADTRNTNHEPPSPGNILQWRGRIVAGELSVRDWLNAQGELPAGMEWSNEDIQIFERAFQQYPNNRMINPQRCWKI